MPQPEVFRHPMDAKHVNEPWRRHYNEVRPHSSLVYLTPAEFKQQSLMTGDCVSEGLRALFSSRHWSEEPSRSPSLPVSCTHASTARDTNSGHFPSADTPADLMRVTNCASTSNTRRERMRMARGMAMGLRDCWASLLHRRTQEAEDNCHGDGRPAAPHAASLSPADPETMRTMPPSDIKAEPARRI